MVKLARQSRRIKAKHPSECLASSESQWERKRTQMRIWSLLRSEFNVVLFYGRFTTLADKQADR